MKLPVFKAIGASFAYFMSHGLDLLKALWLPTLLFNAAIIYALPKYMGPMLAIMELGPTPNPQQAAALMGPALQWIGVILLAAFVFQPMSYVGAMRHVLRGQSLRAPFYLGFGADELRVAAAFILMMIMFTLVYVVGALSFVALTAALGALAIGAAAPVVLVLGGVFSAVMVWLALRLSLSLAATVAEKKIGLPYSWRAGKGNSAALLLYFLFWIAVMVPAAALYMMLVMPNYFGDVQALVAAGDDLAKAHEVQVRMTREQVEGLAPGSPGFPLRAATIYVYNLFMNALWTVPPAIAYRYLAADKAQAR
ncbi:MAG: hypothetical protein ABL957_03790 [Parvularculaceae bacterium]